MKLTILITIMAALFMLLLSSCMQNNTVLVGNDTDAHGCKPSAGYSWCEARLECIRSWETPCLTEEEISSIVSSYCNDNVTYANLCGTYILTIDNNKPDLDVYYAINNTEMIICNRLNTTSQDNKCVQLMNLQCRSMNYCH